MTETNENQPQQDVSPAAPVDATPSPTTQNDAEQVETQGSPVVPDNSGVPEDNAAEPRNAGVEHEASAEDVEG